MKVFLISGLFVGLLLFGCIGGFGPTASPEPTVSPAPAPMAGVSGEVAAASDGIDDILNDSAAVGNYSVYEDYDLNVTEQDLDA
ncbi:hypothetical protein AUJ14_01820 [Candidatus Micrarchaeota archaeon CG1_02_55_22]|nr:MAG: hypothetical protein AUJ14_01820 [Candidatus Micrarchaeota archaeon CG1_02_55_22]